MEQQPIECVPIKVSGEIVFVEKSRILLSPDTRHLSADTRHLTPDTRRLTHSRQDLTDTRHLSPTPVSDTRQGVSQPWFFVLCGVASAFGGGLMLASHNPLPVPIPTPSAVAPTPYPPAPQPIVIMPPAQPQQQYYEREECNPGGFLGLSKVCTTERGMR